MEWLESLKGQVVALDTAPLVYFIEEHEKFGPLVFPFFEALNRGELRAITSVVTLLEVLVQPIRHKQEALAREYRQILLENVALTVVPASVQIAEKAAELRAAHGLRTPDAIQLATALSHGAGAILTNDADWPSITNLQVLVLSKLLIAPGEE